MGHSRLGFLRLLGVAGQQIPHDLAARTAVYRAWLAGTRTLTTEAAAWRTTSAGTPRLRPQAGVVAD
jgi:hypothetical protein